MTDDVAAPEMEGGFLVDFSLAPGRYVEDGFAVYPNSLLFRAGEYADKAFSITPCELAAVARDWLPIRGNIEHRSFLRGRAGIIPEAWTAEEDRVLRGVVKVPLALDCLLNEDEKRVSLEMDRKTLRPIAFALTTVPRVADAVLMGMAESAEFARHDTYMGDRGVQEMHTLAVRFGAVCGHVSDRAGAAVQTMHDTACEHGARCGEEIGAAHTRDDGPPPRGRARGENRTMTLKERLKAGLLALFVKAGVPETEAAEELDRVDLSVDDETRELAARFAQMQAERIREQAEAWADLTIRAGRALPAERPAMIAAFVQAEADDDARPATVTFTSGTGALSATRRETLQALFALRRPHDLLAELVREGGAPAAALFNQMETGRRGEPRPMSEERRTELLRATPEGRAALASKSDR
jgi:hypothetical protein